MALRAVGIGAPVLQVFGRRIVDVMPIDRLIGRGRRGRR